MLKGMRRCLGDGKMFGGVEEVRLGNRERYGILWEHNVIWSNARWFGVIER